MSQACFFFLLIQLVLLSRAASVAILPSALFLGAKVPVVFLITGESGKLHLKKTRSKSIVKRVRARRKKSMSSSAALATEGDGELGLRLVM